MEKLTRIERYGKQVKGRVELIAHLEGKRLTLRQMILAKCYDCMGYFVDGKVDCNISDCALYPLMPYRKGEKYQLKTISADRRAALKKMGRSLPRKTPSTAKVNGSYLAKQKENPGGIPNPSPGETESSSIVKNLFPGITPEGQAPDPSQVGKSRKRGRKPKEREQIPLFSTKGIPDPDKTSGKQTTGKGVREQ
jgi:hypothetical protein